MLRKLPLAAAALSIAWAPCAAAGLERSAEIGERRSGAVAGVYLSMPFGGQRSGKPKAGLRLQATHDYRHAAAPGAPVFQADALDLRLVGDKHATLYVAGIPATGEEARKRNLVGGGGIVTVAILALAAVGALVIYNAIDDDEEDNCLDPALCD